MGYTHYWYRPALSEIDPDTWNEICFDIHKLAAALPPKGRIVRECDRPDERPLIGEEIIAFNGRGKDGHETFVFPRDPGPAVRPHYPDVFGFCKTAGKPYDVAVCATLAVIADRAPDLIKVTSDGKRPDWQPAVDWASKVLGRVIAVPLVPPEAA